MVNTRLRALLGVKSLPNGSAHYLDEARRLWIIDLNTGRTPQNNPEIQKFLSQVDLTKVQRETIKDQFLLTPAKILELMGNQNPYKILDVSINASMEEIHGAHYVLREYLESRTDLAQYLPVVDKAVASLTTSAESRWAVDLDFINEVKDRRGEPEFEERRKASYQGSRSQERKPVSRRRKDDVYAKHWDSRKPERLITGDDSVANIAQRIARSLFDNSEDPVNRRLSDGRHDWAFAFVRELVQQNKELSQLQKYSLLAYINYCHDLTIGRQELFGSNAALAASQFVRVLQEIASELNGYRTLDQEAIDPKKVHLGPEFIKLLPGPLQVLGRSLLVSNRTLEEFSDHDGARQRFGDLYRVLAVHSKIPERHRSYWFLEDNGPSKFLEEVVDQSTRLTEVDKDYFREALQKLPALQKPHTFGDKRGSADKAQAIAFLQELTRKVNVRFPKNSNKPDPEKIHMKTEFMKLMRILEIPGLARHLR